MPVRGRARAAHAPGAGPSTTLRYNPVEMVWGRNADEARAADNPLSDRFTIRRRLGVGSFGIVYEALDKVNSGEMPPKKQPQPTQKEISDFVTSLDARLKEGRAARMAARPAVARPLSPQE